MMTDSQDLKTRPIRCASSRFTNIDFLGVLDHGVSNGLIEV